MGGRLWEGIEFSRQRQTEWAAGWYYKDRRIMMLTHDGLVTLVPPRYIGKRPIVLDVEWLGAPQHVHRLCYGQVCVECGQRKPLSDYHLDAKTATGFKTICKACRCMAERERYRQGIGREPRAYRNN